MAHVAWCMQTNATTANIVVVPYKRARHCCSTLRRSQCWDSLRQKFDRFQTIRNTRQHCCGSMQTDATCWAQQCCVGLHARAFKTHANGRNKSQHCWAQHCSELLALVCTSCVVQTNAITANIVGVWSLFCRALITALSVPNFFSICL